MYFSRHPSSCRKILERAYRRPISRIDASTSPLLPLWFRSEYGTFNAILSFFATKGLRGKSIECEKTWLCDARMVSTLLKNRCEINSTDREISRES